MKLHTTGMVVALSLVGLVAGCCQKEIDQIKTLTTEKQELEGQLQQAKDDLLKKEAELSVSRDALAAAKNNLSLSQQEINDLKDKIAKLPAGWTIKGGVAMTSLEDSVLFDAGKAVLKPTASKSLDKVASEISRNFPGQDIYIVGHTDSDPIRKSKWQDNLELSLARSAAVARYMKTRGLDLKHVVVGGCGEYRPTASNSERGGKAKNRRVEFWVLKAPPAAAAK